jgi:hypothetical protein
VAKLGDEWLNKGKQVANYKEVCGVVGRWVAYKGGGGGEVRREVRFINGRYWKGVLTYSCSLKNARKKVIKS